MNMLRRLGFVLGSSCVMFILLGCQGGARLSPYRMPIDQGKHIESSKLSAVKVGMHKNEVLKILGEPLIRDIFHASRWDYPLQNTKGSAEVKNFAVIFEGDYVKQVIAP
jgi:outer membrane protein assembly factor BamE